MFLQSQAISIDGWYTSMLYRTIEDLVGSKFYISRPGAVAAALG